MQVLEVKIFYYSYYIIFKRIFSPVEKQFFTNSLIRRMESQLIYRGHVDDDSSIGIGRKCRRKKPSGHGLNSQCLEKAFINNVSTNQFSLFGVCTLGAQGHVAGIHNSGVIKACPN